LREEGADVLRVQGEKLVCFDVELGL
jgi:hypothetical protein